MIRARTVRWYLFKKIHSTIIFSYHSFRQVKKNYENKNQRLLCIRASTPVNICLLVINVVLLFFLMTQHRSLTRILENITYCSFSEYILIDLRINCAYDSNVLKRIRTSTHRSTCTFYTEYILLTMRIHSEDSKQAAAADPMVYYTIVSLLLV